MILRTLLTVIERNKDIKIKLGPIVDFSKSDLNFKTNFSASPWGEK